MATAQIIELAGFNKWGVTQTSPMLVSTGNIYRARNNSLVGPLRPFRDEEDGPHTDAAGRSAWFIAEGLGAFDKHGEFLNGGTLCPLDLVAEWFDDGGI
ncbi:hypothetical protein [Mesorhizobium sp. M0129]|uniref:hypothetical protein n=1 Tax=Mesorhizobium sp. M0129 TaxID=2956886 RepID=UPI003335BC32